MTQALVGIVKAENLENTASSTFNFHSEILYQNSPQLQKWLEEALNTRPLRNTAINAAYKVYKPLKSRSSTK